MMLTLPAGRPTLRPVNLAEPVYLCLLGLIPLDRPRQGSREWMMMTAWQTTLRAPLGEETSLELSPAALSHPQAEAPPLAVPQPWSKEHPPAQQVRVTSTHRGEGWRLSQVRKRPLSGAARSLQSLFLPLQRNVSGMFGVLSAGEQQAAKRKVARLEVPQAVPSLSSLTAPAFSHHFVC